MKAKRSPDPAPPESVTNEVLMPREGEPRYWLMLGDDHVEALATGRCPEDVAKQAFLMLGWKREQHRMAARQQPLIHDEVA